MCRLVVAVLLVSGCANPEGGHAFGRAPDLDLVPGGDDGGVTEEADLASASASDDLRSAPAAADLASAPDLRVACNPVINEVLTASASSASYEFIELYNGCSVDIPLDGWKLVYRSAGNNSGAGDTALYTFPANVTVAKGGYYLVGGTAYTGTKDATFTSGGLATGGGAVALRNAQGTVIDSVAYQTLTTTNVFTEGTAASNAAAGSSIQRMPNGSDTNDNGADFQVRAPTPRAAN